MRECISAAFDLDFQPEVNQNVDILKVGAPRIQFHSSTHQDARLL
jgi:hypothetical protein